MLGLIGEKIGMSQYFSEEGNLLPVSLIKIEPNCIVKKKTVETDGYNALVLGVKDLKEDKVNKPYKGVFGDKIAPKRVLKEIRLDNVDNYEVGQELTVKEFENINYVDVIGISKGKGYQGVMKRHGFSGGRKTHGSKFHRQNGSTGQCAYPSKVFKGVKRAGRMGTDRITVQSLKVVKVDEEKNVVIVKGAIPGTKKGTVIIKNACKKS